MKKESNESAIPDFLEEIGPMIIDSTSNDKKVLEDSDIDKIADKILTTIPEGISSLIEEAKPKEDEVFLMLIFKSPKYFYEKYSTSRTNSLDEYKYLAAAQTIAGNEKREDTQNFDSNGIPLEVINVDDENNEEIETKIWESKAEKEKYKHLLHEIFEQFEKSFDNLIDVTIEKYIAKKNEELKIKNLKLYERLNKASLRLTNKNFEEFSYEGFLDVFCSIIIFYSHINIKIDFSAAKNEILLYFYGSEAVYDKLANYFDYELQLAPRAIEYAKTHQEDDNEEKNDLLQSFILHDKTLQFRDYDINNAVYWPPYYVYKSEKQKKYRRYTKCDDFHDCKSDDGCECSKYRGIDKLRLIYRMIDYLLKFSNMYRYKLLHMILFNRSYASYKERISPSIVFNDTFNPFDTKRNSIMIHNMRNYFGEAVSFFFLWLDSYTRWLVFPAIVGVFLTLSYYMKERVPLVAIFSSRVHMDYYDFLLIIFCVIISFWLTLFTNTWKQKERLYSYLWGMENNEETSPLNEEFVPNDKEDLIFGYAVPIEKKFYHKLKKLIANGVLLVMIFIVCFFVYYLFRLKANMVNGDEWHDFKVAIKIASLNAIQIKIMNFIYYYLASALNSWENHSRLISKNNSLALKLILFDCVNSYSALLYIAFIKPYNEGCQYGNCLKEIEMQIYTIFLIHIGLYILEILYPMAIMYYNLSAITKLLSRDKRRSYRVSIVPQSIEHQVLCSRITTMNFEYNNIVIQFGYVCLFSVAAPLTPLIVFILAMLGRSVNYYKIFQLERVEFVDGAKGIAVYNKIIKFMFFAGMMVNVAIVLFSSPHFATIELTVSQIEFKLLIFAAVENLVLIIMYYVDWDVMPKWFKYVKTIKELYSTKFVFRDQDDSASEKNSEELKK